MKLSRLMPFVIQVCVSTSLLSTTLTLQWDDNSNNEAGFCLEYSFQNQTDWVSYDTLDANIDQYGPITLTEAGIHYFRVYAFYASGNSDPSNVLSVTVDPSAPDPPADIVIENDGTDRLILSWPEVPDATGYHVYSSDSAFFTPSEANRIASNVTDQDLTKPGVQWSDNGESLGDPSANFFFRISSVNMGQESEVAASIYGEFEYTLEKTATTSFNSIALPLNVAGITDAKSLMDSISGCNSVAQWNPSSQGYEQYIPGVSATNFAIQPGYSYMIHTTQNTTVTFTGEVVSPNFNLITTGKTNFNEVVIPLDKTNITKASQLMEDIPNCNSIAYWNAHVQGFIQYIPGISLTDFNVSAGYSYLVHVTSNTDWPSSSPNSKAVVVASDAAAKNNAPHAVWGKLTSDQDENHESDLGFTAYIATRPEDKITHLSPGCFIEDGCWVVQCKNFSEWSEGETLCVEFTSRNSQSEAEIMTELSYNPEDYAGNVALQNQGNDLHNTGIPTRLDLGQNYPNPFNPSTMIPYQLPEAGHVHISIFNSIGQEVRVLVDEMKEAGHYQVMWDGLNNHRSPVSSNVYVVRLQFGGKGKTMKILYMR